MHDIIITENDQDYVMLNMALHIAHKASKTNTSFGGLVRNLEYIDPESFQTILESIHKQEDKRRFQLNENAVLHLIAAFYITRKAFLCDAIDEILRVEEAELPQFVRDNVTLYCTARINQYSEFDQCKTEVLQLLAKLDKDLPI
jgi:hypothetical protein